MRGRKDTQGALTIVARSTDLAEREAILTRGEVGKPNSLLIRKLHTELARLPGLLDGCLILMHLGEDLTAQIPCYRQAQFGVLLCIPVDRFLVERKRLRK